MDKLARDEKVSVMLNPKIKWALQAYADASGLTVSALCAFVLGDFVRREERLLGPMTDKLGEALLQHIKDFDGEVERLKRSGP